jgi:hypothetical protein
MGQKRGGLKLRRCGKDKPYYTAQFYRTKANKARRADKRARKKEFWNEYKRLETQGTARAA